MQIFIQVGSILCIVIGLTFAYMAKSHRKEQAMTIPWYSAKRWLLLPWKVNDMYDSQGTAFELTSRLFLLFGASLYILSRALF